MTAAEVREALRRHYGLAASDLGAEEWTLHDEVPIAKHGATTIDVLAVRAWRGMPKGHERHALEIKVSRSDFRRELESRKWEVWHAITHRFAFVVPAGLIPAADVPAGCGLAEVGRHGVVWQIEAPRHDADPLPEAVWVELARRASRLAERLRRGEGDAARVAALELDLRKAEARAERGTTAIAKYRRRITELLQYVRAGGVVCECGDALDYRHHGNGYWHWVHSVEPGDEPPTETPCRFPRPTFPELIEATG